MFLFVKSIGLRRSSSSTCGLSSNRDSFPAQLTEGLQAPLTVPWFPGGDGREELGLILRKGYKCHYRPLEVPGDGCGYGGDD